MQSDVKVSQLSLRCEHGYKEWTWYTDKSFTHTLVRFYLDRLGKLIFRLCFHLLSPILKMQKSTNKSIVEHGRMKCTVSSLWFTETIRTISDSQFPWLPTVQFQIAPDSSKYVSLTMSVDLPTLSVLFRCTMLQLVRWSPLAIGSSPFGMHRYGYTQHCCWRICLIRPSLDIWEDNSDFLGSESCYRLSAVSWDTKLWMPIIGWRHDGNTIHRFV